MRQASGTINRWHIGISLVLAALLLFGAMAPLVAGASAGGSPLPSPFEGEGIETFACTINPSPADSRPLTADSCALNNPLKYTDPSGHFAFLALLPWLLLAADVGFTAYDAYNYYQDPSSENAAWLGVDLVGGAVLGKALKVGSRALRYGDEVLQGLRAFHAGEAGRLGRGAELSDSLRELSERNITDSGKTVLGHIGYITKAKSMNASYFDIGKVWDTLPEAQRLAANRHFLDVIAERGDQVYLSVAKSKIRPNSYLSAEIEYLTRKKGYQWVNQWSLVRR